MYRVGQNEAIIGVGDGGKGGTCPLEFGKHIFLAIIMKNSGIFRAKSCKIPDFLLIFRANIIKIRVF